MATMVYSTHSHEKVMHKSHCHVIRRIQKKYRRTFNSPKEALAKGYCQCKYCCPSIETLLQQDRENIEPLLSKEKLKLTLKNGQAEVQSKEGLWRITQDPETLRLQLFHKNTYTRATDLHSQMPGYHLQTSARANTIIGFLKFISTHDDYRSEHPVEYKNDNGFIPRKFEKQGQWEAAKAKKVKKNGRSYMVNVQLRSEPDLSPWLTGYRNDTVYGFGKHNRKKKRNKPTDESDAA